MQVELVGQFGDAPVDTAHVVEVAVDAQIFGHRQAVRQGDVGRGEVHPRQCGKPVARHVVAEHLDTAGGRDQQAEQHGDSGGLAGAIAAEQPDDRPLRHGKADPVNGPLSAIDLDQIGDGDGRM